MYKKISILFAVIFTTFFGIQANAQDCPDKSVFDDLSQTCKCQSGYVMEQNVCISQNQYCLNSFGINSRYNAVSNKCECNYGYIAVSGQCINANTYCQDKSGVHSSYDLAEKVCVCDEDYIKNSSGRCISQSSYCNNIYGDNSEYNLATKECVCERGYILLDENCVDGDKYCRSKAGSHSSYDIMQKSCVCEPGYKMNNEKCVEIKITGVLPNKAEVGDKITIQGANLGDANSRESIFVGADTVSRSDIISWSDNQIIFFAEDYISGGTVMLKTDDGLVYSGPYLEITKKEVKKEAVADPIDVKATTPDSKDSSQMTLNQQININGTPAGQADNNSSPNSSNKETVSVALAQKPGVFSFVTGFMASILTSVKNIFTSLFS